MAVLATINVSLSLWRKLSIDPDRNRVVLGSLLYNKSFYHAEYDGGSSVFIYKDGDLISSKSLFPGNISSNWSRTYYYGGGMGIINDAFFFPGFQLVKASFDLHGYVFKFDLATEVWSAPFGPEWVANYNEVTGSINIGACDLCTDRANSRMFSLHMGYGPGIYSSIRGYQLDSDGVSDHRCAYAYHEYPNSGKLYWVDYAYVTANGSNVEYAWRNSINDDGKYSYAYVAAAAEDATPTSRVYNISAIYAHRTFGPQGLYIRGTDRILRKLGSGTTWDISSYIDGDYNWGIIQKVDGDNNYYIITRSGIALYYLYLANNGTVTKRSERACTTDFDFRSYHALYNYTSAGEQPSWFNFGSAKELYQLPDLWKEVI